MDDHTGRELGPPAPCVKMLPLLRGTIWQFDAQFKDFGN